MIGFGVLLVLAFLEGAAVMVVELTAARLMIPYFGQTVFVWTNVIGVILAAIAVGNYAGGRLADRSKTLIPLFVLLGLSGLFCLLAPHLIAWAAALFLGDGLQLEEVFALLTRASFATSLMIFAPPVILAGACLPFLVKAAAEAVGSVGRASGSVYGCSTMGSIAGTFLTTYWLIESLGSKRTFFVAGLVLVGISLLGFALLFKRGGKTATWGLVLLVPPLAFVLFPMKDFRSGEEVIFESESRYQYVSAVKLNELPETIHLKLNEGLDSFHSIYVKGDVLTGGQYYDYYCLLPALAGMKKPGRVCIIGLAAGTSARQYDHFFGGTELEIDGVEIDPVTVDVGRRFMGLDEVRSSMNVFNDRDGRMFLRASNRRYDVIIIDAYAQQVYIPFHMTTSEFFQEVHDHLAPGGIVGMNVGGFFFTDRLLTGIANTAASVFGSVSVARIPEGRNFMIYAVREKGHVDPRTAMLPEGLERLCLMLEEISAYGLTREFVFDADALVLSDDHAPVERLCDADLIRYSATETSIP